MPYALLFADIDLDTIIRIAVVLIFFVGPVVLKVMSGGEKKKAQARGPARPQAQPRVQATVEDEIEAFLRQARNKQPPAPPEPAPVEAVSVEVVRQPLVQSEPVKATRSRSSLTMGESVGEHVDLHMAEGRVTEHSTHLAEGIAGADEKFEDRLKTTFDHDIGGLKDTTEVPQDDLVSEGTDSEVWNQTP